MNVIYECSFTDFVNDVKATEKQIVCCGAGLVALSIEDIFVDAGICDNVYCFIDRDSRKHGTKIQLNRREIEVKEPNYLLSLNPDNKILLITAADFSSIIEEIKNYEKIKDLSCYIYPLLNISFIKSQIQIPKKIHYCWFGNGEKSDLFKRCIRSWEKFNPDYEVICWHEGNYDVCQNNYTKQAWENKKYAFVSDFARLDILYKHGGIYLDTDVEVLRNFDDLLINKGFMGYGEWAMANSGSGIASIAGLDIIKEMRDYPRSKIDFINSDGSFNLTTNSFYETAVLKKYGFRMDFSKQIIQGLEILPPDFFANRGNAGINAVLTAKTYAIHHCCGTWR